MISCSIRGRLGLERAGELKHLWERGCRGNLLNYVTRAEPDTSEVTRQRDKPQRNNTRNNRSYAQRLDSCAVFTELQEGHLRRREPYDLQGF